MPAKRVVPAGVKQVRKRLASGAWRVYWYHRATGQRIEAEPGTAAALVEVMDLDRKAEKLSPKARKTLADLWIEYRKSPEFQRLMPRTQRDYDAVRSWIGPAATQAVPAAMTGQQILKLRDKAFEEKGRRFANYVVQVLRLVLAWGKPRGWLKGENPAKGVKVIAKPKDERHLNRAWTEAEVRNWFLHAPAHFHLPVALGLFAAMRQGDMVKLKPGDYDGVRVGWWAGKNGEWCEAPATGLFKQLLDAAPKEGERMVLNALGKPWAHEASFRSSFFDTVRDLQKKGLLGKGTTFHGLRHTVGTLARNAGRSEFEVASGIGDRSMAMASTYGRDAARLEAQRGVLTSVQDRFADAKTGAPAVSTEGNSIESSVTGFHENVDEVTENA